MKIENNTNPPFVANLGMSQEAPSASVDVSKVNSQTKALKAMRRFISMTQRLGEKGGEIRNIKNRKIIIRDGSFQIAKRGTTVNGWCRASWFLLVPLVVKFFAWAFQHTKKQDQNKEIYRSLQSIAKFYPGLYDQKSFSSILKSSSSDGHCNALTHEGAKGISSYFQEVLKSEEKPKLVEVIPALKSGDAYSSLGKTLKNAEKSPLLKGHVTFDGKKHWSIWTKKSRAPLKHTIS